jgi:hypothetical protein
MNDHLYKLVFFLLYAERDDPKMMYGSHTVGEALEVVAAIMHVNVEELRKLI